jgi:hypothetical protein
MHRTNHARFRGWRWLLAFLPLAASLLACNMTMGTRSEDEPGRPTAPPTPTRVASSGPPTVQILSPASGQQVPANQRVDITVETASATRLVLNIDGRVATTTSLPTDQTGPVQAILPWTPQREGTYDLEVVAFTSAQTSPPAALTLQVSGTAAGPDAGATAGCTGRVMVSELNYRDGPGTRAAKLGKFDVGETVTIAARNAATTWYQVRRTNMQLVWVINNPDWLAVSGTCGDLPVES